MILKLLDMDTRVLITALVIPKIMVNYPVSNIDPVISFFPVTLAILCAMYLTWDSDTRLLCIKVLQKANNSTYISVYKTVIESFDCTGNDWEYAGHELTVIHDYVLLI